MHMVADARETLQWRSRIAGWELLMSVEEDDGNRETPCVDQEAAGEKYGKNVVLKELLGTRPEYKEKSLTSLITG